MRIEFEAICQAAIRIKGGVEYTPCALSEPLSQAVGSTVYCKLDYLQRTGSFKERGARNALMLLDAEARKAGVIAASAGNHALGLSYHGRQLGIPVTVVMPKTAPLTKVGNCRNLGARVILHGEYFDEARAKAMEMVASEGLTYINGFDDPGVIAGAGTIGLEIIEQVPDVDAVVIQIGGGGLIAGVGVAVKTLRPNVQVIGVEPARVASFHAAVGAGKPVKIESSTTLADGLAVSMVGQNAFDTARDRIDRLVTVKERFLALAVLRLVELQRGVVEGAGAAGLAAMLAGELPELKGKKVVILLCGGNIDTPVLGRIIDRGLAADGRLCKFQVAVSDRPGGLLRLASVIAEVGASVKDISHDRAFAGEDLNSVIIHCIVETHDFGHIKRLSDRLQEAGFKAEFK